MNTEYGMHKDTMKESLQKCFDKISAAISSSSNRILILDYTYCVLENERPVDVRSYYFEAVPGYDKLLEDFIAKNGNSIGLAGDNKFESISGNSLNKIKPKKKIAFDTYKSGKTTNFNVTSIGNWHSFCIERGLGGFMMTTFYKVSPNHLLGVYLILENPIKPGIKGKSEVLEISNHIKEYLMTEGWSVTYQIVSRPVLKSLLKSDLGFKKGSDLELEELRLYKDDIVKNAHTFFNVLPPSILALDLMRYEREQIYGPNDEIVSRIASELKRLKLTSIVCQIIARREVEHFRDKSICNILELLKKFEIQNVVELDVTNAVEVDFIPLKNNEFNGNANDIFTLLWNLWHNASKFTKTGTFGIRAWPYDGQLAIEFSNTGKEITPEDKKTLQKGERKKVNDESPESGLEISYKIMKKLGWKIVNVSSNKLGEQNLWQNKIVLLTSKN